MIKNIEVSEFYLLLVTEARDEQKRYFSQISKARRTRHPDDFDTANRTKATAKILEQRLDSITAKYLEGEVVTANDYES